MPALMLVITFVFPLMGMTKDVSTFVGYFIIMAYLVLFVTGLVSWIYADWHKKAISQGKIVAKVQLKFMEHNTAQVKGGYEHTLVVEDVPEVSANAPVKKLTEDVMPDLRDKAFKDIMKSIEERLPKLPNGKHYKLVRWHFPDSPFADLMYKDKRWMKGDRGTPINKSILVLVHEDFAKPNEAFDYSPDECPTFYGNYESGQPCYQGTLCLWEFYEATGEWIATPGLNPEHRTTMTQIRPDDRVREYANIVQLLQMIPALTGKEAEDRQLREGIQELARLISTGQAMNTGLGAMVPGFKKESGWKAIKQYKWLILIMVIGIIGYLIFLALGAVPHG
jgi:hypothetical protein